MRIHSIIAIATMGLVGVFTSCTNPYGAANTYKANQAGTAQEVYEGVVVNVESVTLETNSPVIGTSLGAIAGGLSGAMLGGGNAKFATGAGGALIGGIVGNQIDKAVSEKQGIRISVKIDKSNKVLAFVQEADDNAPIQVGQRVQVFVGGNASRVVPLYY